MRLPHMPSQPMSGALQAAGRTERTCDGWQGQRREFKASGQDRSIMLVICPAGRHSDQTEAPQYSLRVTCQAQAAPAGWACKACTYLHAGQEASFLACAVCGQQRFAA